MLQKIKSFLSKGNRAQWCVFVLFAFTIFVKCILFHWDIFHSILISSIWKEPTDFFAFWIPKINIALLLASFIFLFPNKWWTVVVLLLIDLWCISNLIYYRANEMLLSYESLTMASNLSGFESSVIAYWNYQSTFFLLLTILYAVILYFILKPRQKRDHIMWFYLLILVCLLRTTSQACKYANANKLGFVMEGVLNLDKASYIKNIIPYREVVAGIHEAIHFTGSISNKDGLDSLYFRYHSVITYFPKLFVAHIAEKKAMKELEIANKRTEITSVAGVEKFIKISQGETNLTPKTNLVVIIVESFESWLLEAKDENNNLVMPYMNKHINGNANFYFHRIKSQVREGVSGDGQMIINTGILPLQKGSAAILFGSNIFPNWAHLFKQSATIYPGDGGEWNQDTMTLHYKYQKQINPTEGRWEDDRCLDTLVCWLETTSGTPFACQSITVSTHTPFVSHPTSNLVFTDDIPRDLKRYINCFHFTDSCIGVTLQKMEQNGILRNSTIVITGDHTIFKKSQLKEFKPYIESHSLPMSSDINYVPLIISTPTIEQKISIGDICYQMDIYPTIMHLIGCEDYYWKGFGVNLLDSTSRHNRSITEQEAYELSDKLIRSNYFAGIERQQGVARE